MSKKVVLLGGLGADHQGFPPTPVIAGSPDVLIDGKPVARVGDPLALITPAARFRNHQVPVMPVVENDHGQALA